MHNPIRGIPYLICLLDEASLSYKAYTDAVRSDRTPNKDGYIETSAASDAKAIANLKFKTAQLIYGIGQERKNLKKVKLKNFQRYTNDRWEMIAPVVESLLEERNISQLMKTTPKRYKLRAEHVKPTLLTITQSGKVIYKTVTEGNKHVHRQFIKPIPNTREINSLTQNVILFCNCENFMYENEYSLWKVNASNVINATMEPPLKTNPGMKKKVCKHLIAVFEDLKKRLK